MKPRSLRLFFRMIILYIGVISLAITFLLLFYYREFFSKNLQMSTENLRQVGQSIAEQIDIRLQHMDSIALQAVTNTIIVDQLKEARQDPSEQNHFVLDTTARDAIQLQLTGVSITSASRITVARISVFNDHGDFTDFCTTPELLDRQETFFSSDDFQSVYSSFQNRKAFQIILPDIPEDDGCAYLTFYLDEDVDKQELLLKVRQELEEMRSYLNVGECTIEESQTEDVDWVNNWKQYFHQFYIDDILVIPSWENVEAKDSDKMVIHIDPGTAFGTGMHETTQLCIRQLKKYVTEDTEILDVGCGSGILGMLALKFGAKHSVGTDLDPCAIDATYENMDNNGISRDQYEVMIGNIIDDKAVQDKVGYEKYDIVAANILADVLVPLTPVIIHQMKKGGIYITSGIIEDKEDVVVEAVKEAGLEVLEVNHQGEWVSVTARKN